MGPALFAVSGGVGEGGGDRIMITYLGHCGRGENACGGCAHCADAKGILFN